MPDRFELSVLSSAQQFGLRSAVGDIEFCILHSDIVVPLAGQILLTCLNHAFFPLYSDDRYKS